MLSLFKVYQRSKYFNHHLSGLQKEESSLFFDRVKYWFFLFGTNLRVVPPSLNDFSRQSMTCILLSIDWNLNNCLSNSPKYVFLFCILDLVILPNRVIY